MQYNDRTEKISPSFSSRAEIREARLARTKVRAKLFALACLLVLMVAVPLWSFVSKRSSTETAYSSHESAPVQINQLSDQPPNQLPNQPIISQETDTIVFIGLGDMLFDRQVATLIKTKGANAPFTAVRGVLKTADVVAGNLECPLSTRGRPVPDKEYTFRGRPEAAAGMKSSGINVVSLANNHILDYGRDPLFDTIELLKKAGVAYAGAGKNMQDACEPAILNVKGKRVAFIAYTSIVPSGFWATSKQPGVATTRPSWTLLKGIISKAARENDLVIVSFHWGIEYQDYPQAYQRDFAKKAIDAGADIVIGHHPHVIQGIEVYKGKPIAYSLGGFVFDHYSKKTGETFIFKVTRSDNAISKIEIIPVYMDATGKPMILSGASAKALLSRIKTISAPLKTDIKITGNTAEVRVK